MLILWLRPSRRKARDAAVAELLSVLHGLGARRASGGPLSHVAGVAWVMVPETTLPQALGRLRRLGYVSAIDILTPLTGGESADGLTTVRWRGQKLALMRAYDEPDEALLPFAPDRRTFLLECGDGVVRPIAGYRGGRGELEHRALPFVDARLLVNLAVTHEGDWLLDPFAGGGGVVLAARQRGCRTVSMDVDRMLRYGLAAIADFHVVGSAASLPFASTSLGAVATEPPYHESAVGAVLGAIAETARVLCPGGRAAFLLAAHQLEDAKRAGEQARLSLEHELPIDRKGTSVVCLCWRR